MSLKELQEQLRALLVKARDVSAAAEKAGRDFTAEERQQITGWMNEAKDIKAKLKQVQDDNALRDAVKGLGDDIQLLEGQKRAAGSGAPVGKGRTWGEQFVESPALKAWMATMAPSGMIPETLKGIHSPPVAFGSMLSMFGRKELITGASDTSAGAFVQTDYSGIYEPLGRQPLTVRDLVSIRQTTSDLIEFVRQTVQVQEAAPTPEANVKYVTGATGEISGTKPQGKMNFEKVQVGVKTIAVYVGATKRALSDASQIRGIIDQELREDTAEEFEDQIVNGDGVGESFTGLLNTAGILQQAYDTDLLRTLRKAKTLIRKVGRSMPTAWLMNPTDFEEIDLLTAADGHFYFGGPMAEGVRRVWGVPVVESETMPEGRALLGNFRKAVVWDREQTSISVTDSHDDWFIRNMIAILCEMRAAFGVIRPSAFVEVDLTP
jgi:HK97 family phage major capsid protein